MKPHTLPCFYFCLSNLKAWSDTSCSAPAQQARNSLTIAFAELSVCDFLFQGAGAGQLRSMEAAILFPLQDERQRWDGCTGPLCVSCIRQKGTAAELHHDLRIKIHSKSIIWCFAREQAITD